MSQTYHLLCVDCKESLWIGEGGYDVVCLYTGCDGTRRLELFLNKHKYHQLRFIQEDFCDDFNGIKEMELNTAGDALVWDGDECWEEDALELTTETFEYLVKEQEERLKKEG